VTVEREPAASGFAVVTTLDATWMVWLRPECRPSAFRPRHFDHGWNGALRHAEDLQHVVPLVLVPSDLQTQ
jgi:hypothetical protein